MSGYERNGQAGGQDLSFLSPTDPARVQIGSVIEVYRRTRRGEGEELGYGVVKRREQHPDSAIIRFIDDRSRGSEKEVRLPLDEHYSNSRFKWRVVEDPQKVRLLLLFLMRSVSYLSLRSYSPIL